MITDHVIRFSPIGAVLILQLALFGEVAGPQIHDSDLQRSCSKVGIKLLSLG